MAKKTANKKEEKKEEKITKSELKSVFKSESNKSEPKKKGKNINEIISSQNTVSKNSQKNPYQKEAAKIVEKKQFTNDTYFFTIKTTMPYEAGQFIEIDVPLYGEAPISIGSYKEGYMDLLIRNVGNVTNQLVKLNVGDNMLIRGPYGKGYPLSVLKGNNVIIVSGGTGTAPIRGVIEYIEKNRPDFKDITIFLGFRSPDAILFNDDIKDWEKKYNTILSVDNATTLWSGRTGVITKYIDESNLNNVNKVVFLCGPPIMIKFAIESLKRKGFHDDQIFISMERNMKCGVGKCGHCMIHGKYTCKDGPVFRYDEVKDYKND